jgi:hypothetical protein
MGKKLKRLPEENLDELPLAKAETDVLDEAPLKKKDESDLSPKTGSSDSTDPAKQQEQPSSKSTESTDPEKVRNPFKSFAKSAWAVRNDLISATLATTAAVTAEKGVGPSSFALGTMKPMREDIEKGQPIGTTLKKEALQKKLNLLTGAAQFQQKSAEEKKNLVNSLGKIEDPVDAINWVFSAVGQAAGQIPLGIATGGGSMFMQEMGSIYLDGVQKLSEESGESIEDIIAQGKDDSLTPLIFGTAAAGLDMVGAKGVMDAIGKKELMRSMRNRALALLKTGGKEAVTEAIQTNLENIGVNRSADKSWGETLKDLATKENLMETLESAAQGFVGGTGLTAIGQVSESVIEKIKKPKQLTEEDIAAPVEDVVEEKSNAVDPNNIESIEEAAEIIDEKVQSESIENLTTEEDGLQERSAEEVLSGEQEGTGEQGSERGGVEPGIEGEGVTETSQAQEEAIPTDEGTQVVDESTADMVVGNYIKKGNSWYFKNKDGNYEPVLDLTREVPKEEVSKEVAELKKVLAELEAPDKKQGKVKDQKERDRIKTLPRDTLYTRVRGYLIDGGKIKWATTKEQGKSKISGVKDETGMADSEMGSLRWINDKNGPSVEQIAEKLAKQYGDEDVQAYRNALNEVITTEDRSDWFKNQRNESDSDLGIVRENKKMEAESVFNRIQELEGDDIGKQQAKDLYENERRVYSETEGARPGETGQISKESGTESGTQSEPDTLIRENGNESESEQAVKDLSGLNLTHVPGLGMGQNQAKGTYISTEKEGNRYETADNKPVKAKVKVKKPFVTTNEKFAEIQRAAIQKRFSKKSIDDLSESEIDLLAEMMTDYFHNSGFDSVYFPESANQEGELIVFDRKNVELENIAAKDAKMEAEIKEAGKPDVSIDLMDSSDAKLLKPTGKKRIVKSGNRTAEKNEIYRDKHNDIVKKQKVLKNLIDCLWA